ncbi:MAG: PQQ-binding-like beta-propeller repeat protein [Candidatus Methanofastidiosia archaeon]
MMKYERFKHIVGLTFLGLLMSYSTSTDDWICYRGSPERTGSSDASAPDTCYLLWELNAGSKLFASPVVKDGKVFQVGLENLYCADLETGEVFWVSLIPVYQSTPFLTDKEIIVATNRGISCLPIENGTKIWEYVYSGRFRPEAPLEDYIISSPVVSEGKVVVGTMPYRYVETNPFMLPEELFLVCVDQKSGKEVWYLETGLGVLSSPCIAYGRIFASSRGMLCIDLKTGKVLWSSEDKYPYDFQKPVNERYDFGFSTPALFHGILTGGSSPRQWSIAEERFIEWQKIVFMDQYTGEILGKWVEEGVLACSPSVHQGSVFVYSLDGFVRCVSFLEGKELWKTPISEPREKEIPGFRLWPSPTVADGKVYIGSIEGVIYCLDAETGEVLWTYKTGGEIRSAPAIVNGKVLVSSTDGKLYCFGIDPGTYLLKAQRYLGSGQIEKAKQFLVNAKELAETDEEITDIDNLMEIVDEKMPEYEKKMEKVKKAESLMDEADKIMWNKKFTKAYKLYGEAHTIFQEVDDDFGKEFCMERMEYITQRMPEETTEISWYWLGILAVLGAAAYLLIRKKRHKNLVGLAEKNE